MMLFNSKKALGWWAALMGNPALGLIVTAISGVLVLGYTAVKNAISPPSPAPLGFLNSPWIIGGIIILAIIVLLKK